jgi:hypothetical protein
MSSKKKKKVIFKVAKFPAPSEDRTHDLQIMRLTRCLLRHRGLAGRCWDFRWIKASSLSSKSHRLVYEQEQVHSGCSLFYDDKKKRLLVCLGVMPQFIEKVSIAILQCAVIANLA